MPEVCWISSPSFKQRAQGRPGARCTRGLVCTLRKTNRTRAYRYSRRHPAFPAQWVDGLCRGLPGETSSVATVALRIADAAGPVGQVAPPQDLAPASGARTARFCRTRRRRSFRAMQSAHGLIRPANACRADAARVHRSPHSTYRDDAYALLSSRRDGAREAPISGKGKWNIFSAASGLKWLDKFACRRRRFPASIDARVRGSGICGLELICPTSKIRRTLRMFSSVGWVSRRRNPPRQRDV